MKKYNISKINNNKATEAAVQDIITVLIFVVDHVVCMLYSKISIGFSILPVYDLLPCRIIDPDCI